MTGGPTGGGPVRPPVDLSRWRRMEAAASADRQEFVVHCEAEARRIAGIGDPRDRLRDFARLTTAMEEHGMAPSDTILAGHADAQNALRAQTGAVASSRPDDDTERRAATWEVERRRLTLMHTLQTLAPTGIFLAALLPFVVSAWRRRQGLGDALLTFLTPGAPLIGVAVAVVGAGVLARLVDRANSLDGLAGLLVGGLMAGIAGLAVALGRVF